MAKLSADDESAEDADERRGERKHALWGLSVLALLAVLVIALTLFFSGTPGSGRHGQPIDLGIPTDVATPSTPVSTPATASAPATHHGATRSPSHARTRSRVPTSPAGTSTSPADPTSPTPHEAAATEPCVGSRPCTLPGDGGVTAALNADRQQAGTSPAAVSVSSAAQLCAESGGARCSGQYAVQTAAGQNGRQAVTALAGSSGNAWLFSAQTSALQVGWAYLPSLHEYVVALLAG